MFKSSRQKTGFPWGCRNPRRRAGPCGLRAEHRLAQFEERLVALTQADIRQRFDRRILARRGEELVSSAPLRRTSIPRFRQAQDQRATVVACSAQQQPAGTVKLGSAGSGTDVSLYTSFSSLICSKVTALAFASRSGNAWNS